MKFEIYGYKWSFVLILSPLILLLGCGLGSKSLRITVDKQGREMARQEKERNKVEEQPDFVRPSAAASKSKTVPWVKEEELEDFTSKVFNLVINAQSMLQKGEYKEAENNILKALEMIPGRELYLLLADIYELQNDKIKADSCRVLAGSIKKVN